jgi:glycosyltransferase involved in cell wall biosynthesis
MTGIKKLLCSSGDKISCWLAHRIFAVSNSLCREVLKRGYCNEEKIKVLANGSFNGLDAKMRFNPEEYPRETRALLRRKYGIPEDAIVLGYIGRIVRDKGIIELTQAWTRLRAEFKNLYLLMVGDFEAGDSVGREVYEALKNDDRVFITGFIYNNIPEHYIAMDIVVLPTYREGLGYTILEGSAMRLPVVATKVCGCVDVVEDGKTGLLVPPKNEKALYEAIKKMSLDESLRDRLGRAGRQRVLECFTQELIWETLFKEYLSLMKKRNLQFPS